MSKIRVYGRRGRGTSRRADNDFIVNEQKARVQSIDTVIAAYQKALLGLAEVNDLVVPSCMRTRAEIVAHIRALRIAREEML